MSIRIYVWGRYAEFDRRGLANYGHRLAGVLPVFAVEIHRG